MMTLWVGMKNISFAAEAERNYYLQQSYLEVVTGVMNGEVRMKVGDELFECKGGSLGKG